MHNPKRADSGVGKGVDPDAPHREQHLDDVDVAVERGAMEGGFPGAQRAAGSPMPNARKCSMPKRAMHAATCACRTPPTCQRRMPVIIAIAPAAIRIKNGLARGAHVHE